ncbi:MAG TPA: hypothetical protein GX739_02785 [Firmicutes bacterium]|nr:hypothetical protein [Bacillota bacterium]
MKLKAVSCILAVVLLVSPFTVAAQSTTSPLAVLSELERVLFGQEQPGALLARVEAIEVEIFGTAQSGPVMTRIDRIDEYLSGDLKGSGLKLQLNLVEWGFLEKLTANEPLVRRLERIEMEFIGEPQSGSIVDRVDQLMMYIWGTTKLDAVSIKVPAETLVEIQILTSVDSALNKVGDLVKYQVASDVAVDGRIVIPRGSQGVGKITEVVKAGGLGKSGRVVIDFGSVSAFDGKNIRLRVAEKALERNSRLELAAGASMAGVLLLGGPIGLVSGYFIKGEDVQIEAGSKFFVETEIEYQTLGFRLVPAN